MYGDEKSKSRKTFVMETSWNRFFQNLNNDDSGLLIKAIYEHIISGQSPSWENDGTVLSVAYDFIIPKLDEYADQYDKRCKINSENRKRGWEKEKRTKANEERNPLA